MKIIRDSEFMKIWDMADSIEKFLMIGVMTFTAGTFVSALIFLIKAMELI